MGNYHWALWEVEDIVGFILQRLPLTELMQARLVCRRWNRVVLLQRSKIAWCYEMYNGVMDYKQSRLLVRRSEGRLFDPFLLSWRKVSAPPLSHANIDGYVLNSSGECGLIALCERPRRNNPDGPTTRFWVGNPLINKWKCIPRSPRFVISNDVPVSFLHFIVSEGPPVSYMIVAIVPERREVRFGMHAITRTCGVNVIIYSSITQEWRFGATTTTFRQWYPAGSSLNNGRIYFVSHRYVKGSYRTGMVSYSLEHDEFDLVGQAPTERNNMSMLGILVEDNQVPALYCVVRHPGVKEPTLEFYEFEPNEQGQGWESKNTSKYDALKEGLPVTGAYE